MTGQLLPHIAYLRGAVAGYAPLVADDPDQALLNSATIRLLDVMAVNEDVGVTLKADAYARAAALLPAIGAAGIATDGLRAVTDKADPQLWDGFLAALGQVQRDLILLPAGGAGDLVRQIVAIETDYNIRHIAAVLEQEKKAGARTAAPTARNAREVDEKPLAAWLRETFPDEPDLDIVNCRFITGGYSKFTMFITLDGVKALPREIVMRADASATFGGASSIDEYRLIRTLYDHGVRVPPPIAAEETGEVFGSPFMLTERRGGESVGTMFMLPARDPALCIDVAQQLARLHTIPVDEFGDRLDNRHGKSSDKAREWIAEARRNWAPLDMPSPTFEAAFAWLEANADINDDVPRGLVHGDVHLANMLAENSRITAILDWEFAHVGNPAYDLGYFYDQAVALDSWEAFLDAYGAAGGRVPDQRQQDYAILLAVARLGVMTCQSRHEFTSGAKPALSGAVVIGHHFYEHTIERLNRILSRVL